LADLLEQREFPPRATNTAKPILLRSDSIGFLLKGVPLLGGQRVHAIQWTPANLEIAGASVVSTSAVRHLTARKNKACA
jgi:hypothetical protein